MLISVIWECTLDILLGIGYIFLLFIDIFIFIFDSGAKITASANKQVIFLEESIKNLNSSTVLNLHL